MSFILNTYLIKSARWGLFFLILQLSCTQLFSQTTDYSAPRRIGDIQFRGVKLIEKSLLISTIGSRLGKPLSAVTVSEDIKALHQLGYFKDVSADVEDLPDHQTQLVFIVVEKPRIATISFEGNTVFDDVSFENKLSIYVNNMVNPGKIRSDVRMIREEYRKKGLLQTRVGYKIRRISDSFVSLTYEIREAPKVYLTDINVTGSRFFYPLDIERLIHSSEVDCYSALNESGVFQESKVNIDQQIIVRNYLQNGFINVRIDKPKIVLTKYRDYSKVAIDIHINEGHQYFTGKIDFVTDDGNKLLFDRDKVLKRLNLKSGNAYNPFFQNRDRFRVNDLYSERGYAFSRVRAKTKIHEDQKTVDVTYHITRGEKAYIGRIEIMGNYETLDHVVRRELEIQEHELFNGKKIRQSQSNIDRLGFFAAGGGADFDQSVNEDDQVIDYSLKLQETQTGTFSGSVSYAGNTGASLNLKVSKKNLFGTGKSASISTTQYQKGSSSYDLSLTTPYWLNTQFTNHSSLYSQYKKQSKKDKYDTYDTRTSGFGFGLSYPVWKNWTASSTYRMKNVSYEKIGKDGLTILDGVTKKLYSSVDLGLKYSTVNNPMFPTDGFESSFNIAQYGGGLGGNIDFRRYSFFTRYFQSLNQSKSVIFMAKYTQGFLEQTNTENAIPRDERYRLGGITSVRGHDWNEIEGGSSNYDIKKTHPYQGDYSKCATTRLSDGTPCSSLSKKKSDTRKYYDKHTGGVEKKLLNLELLFPLTREGQNIRGVTFFDMGNVWSEDRMYEITGTKRDPWKFRKSIGLGARIVTPMGVLRFEYGVKLDRENGESAGKFDFHISGLF